MENEKLLLNAEELDAIGEIMNISMGAAATSVSNMLDRPVNITTPSIKQDQMNDIDSSDLEPAVLVKIQYVEGLSGDNVIMLRRRDMQIIIDLLMGNEEPTPEEEFVFDELTLSAACEVMNQMMGASATALSEVMGTVVNISTPVAKEVTTKSEINEVFNDVNTDDPVVAVSFNMMITDALDTTFCCFLTLTLARKLVSQVMAHTEAQVAEIQPLTSTAPVEAPPAPPAPPMEAPAAAAPPPQMAPPPVVAPPPQVAAAPVAPTPPPAAPAPVAPPMPQPQAMAAPQQMPPTDQMQPYPYPPQYMMPGGMQWAPGGYVGAPQSVQSAEFPTFNQGKAMIAPSSSNMNLLMGVQLEISVVIGRTKRKIKDIMEFGQSTIVELDNQTGAPAEIMVNGQLLAHGEVIVIGDNFGVRVTEIVGSKELLDMINQG